MSKEIPIEDVNPIMTSSATLYWTVSASNNLTTPAARSFVRPAPALTEDLLYNAQPPFQRGGYSLPYDNRLTQLDGWRHLHKIENDYIVSLSFADPAYPDGVIIMHSNPAQKQYYGDEEYMTNAKVHQLVTLEDAGIYRLEFQLGDMDGGTGVTAYGVVTDFDDLPDMADLAGYNTSNNSKHVLGYDRLSDHINGTSYIYFAVPADNTTVDIGWVYSTYPTSIGWQTFKIKQLELYKY
jgi:hypothetical protein